MNILILAGGQGTRLWPASKRNQPKQMLPFIGRKTLLQNTYERCLSWVGKKNIYLGTTKAYAKQVKAQLPNIALSNYSIEPKLRERAPAIGLAALIIKHRDPEAVFMTTWSDHYVIEKKDYFKNLLNRVEKYLNTNPKATVIAGVRPTFPSTGFGYIKKGRAHSNEQKLKLFKVDEFKEKPSAADANKFLHSQKYLWNSGYFFWKTSTLLELYNKHLPQIYEILMRIKPHIGTRRQQRIIDKFYPNMPNADIERGLLEKITSDILTVEANFSWADVGSWRVIKDLLSKPNDNLEKGLHVHYNTEGCLIYNYTDKLIGTVGLRDMVVVATNDSMLVANKHSTEDIKEFLKKLIKNPRHRKYL